MLLYCLLMNMPKRDCKTALPLLGLLALFVLLVSCSNSESPYSGIVLEAEADSLPGMLHVSAENSTVTLGTEDNQAKANERPQMKAAFDYSFSMGRHEVTCAEFNGMMEPVTGLVLDCAQDSLPATDVTYYDAVLYANALSKKGGFDSAYTYSRAAFDNEKHCTNLEGFAFRPDVDAYRLPTEAEWMLVAGLNWKPTDGWNSENSGYRLHEVCTAPNQGEGVCDMAGNAM